MKGENAMILFENEAVIISLDETIPCLEWIGKGRLQSQSFRESEHKSLQFYQKYKPEYPALEWYVDARKIGSLLPEDIEWVAHEILPKFEVAGLTKEAFVMPEKALGRFTVRDYSEQSQSGKVTIRMFVSVEDAKNWLKR